MKRIITITILCLGAIAMINGQAALKVASTGKVGINVDAPSSQLQVNSKASGDFIMTARNTLGNEIFGVQEGGTSNGNFFVRDKAGATKIQFASVGRFFINTGNRVGINTEFPNYDFELVGDAAKNTGTMWTNTSDKRSKRNINDFTGGLKEILQINPVTFEYNGKFGTKDDGEVHVGVLAQEIQKVAPNTVKTYMHNTATLAEEETPGYKAKGDEYLAVNPSEVFWMLVNSTKEQQSLIEELRAENNELRKMVSEIHIALEDSKISAKLDGSSLELIGSLAQNNPNPFNKVTAISYFIPENSTSATMVITANDGKVIKEIAITEKGNGTLSLDANSVPTGNYFYTLQIDGKKLDTKKMIISK
jgi:hypothetical protein